MARNKYPEQTVEAILSVSSKLFMEKGYDKTSIQDIINEIGMSKGAIYYHFKSKEEILDAIIEKTFKDSTESLKDLINQTQAENAREKLRIVLEKSLDHQQYSFEDVLEPHVQNPQFIVASIQSTVEKNAPVVEEVIREGIKDGSIVTEYPRECAESFLMLITVWCNPVLFQRNRKETVKRLMFLQYVTKLLGMDIMSDQLIQKMVGIFEQEDVLDV